ncbi:carboxypeptidase-like regulatory domain-containing protein [Williamwhitmania taraxaci]|uniref:CarboxypepD_reg-like domain-containing protein n=1 Tax=Williamwhitmania taraxaci TaxID=1640674 RepID=A0A1G6JBK8_9BACT|nr:carboxypeptidase-like regulatory domain-containing protein [Williamwhitmania taraxaci]SDC16027.1 CarboxypepD_reg-like domain-containing protein [Williamwhitmania taraxaci]
MTIHRIVAIIFLYFLFFSVAFGQVAFTGVVTDKSNGSPVSNASITLHRKLAGDMVAFGITNSQGQYSITLDESLDSVFVCFSCLGYATQQLYVATKVGSRNVALMPEAISINEVSVKADKIWAKRDTINYSVAGFASKSDRTIGDVLKKLPGIDVNKDGAISYGGKPINAFYIEGMDSMDGKYSLATENIPVDAIANVQIFENHQKIKVLENSSFSDRAALNLTLREASKYRWVGSAQLGTGLPVELWDANLFLMNIAKRNQGINLAKSNNAGINIAKQLKVFTLEDFLNGSSSNSDVDLFDIPTISIPLVNDERFLFNKTFMASSNNLWMLSKDWQLRLNVSCLKDRVAQNSLLVDTYLFPNDSALVVVDDRDLVNEQFYFDAMLTLSANTSKFYFNNALKLTGNWSSSSVDGRGSSVNTQRYKTPSRAIQNDFRVIKRIRGVNVTFASFNRLARLPQSLEVRQESPDTIFNGRLNYLQLVQDITHLSAVSNSSASFTLAKGKWYLENKFGLNLQHQEYTSTLAPAPQVDSEFSNRWDCNYFRYSATPKLGFVSEKFRMELSLPLEVVSMNFNDKVLDKTLNWNTIYFTPKLSVRYKFSTKLELSSSVSQNQSIGDPMELSSGYVLSSYRYINRGHAVVSEQKSQSYTVGFAYRNPVTALFVNAMVSFTPSLSDASYVQSIRGIYVINSAIQRSNSRDFWMASSRISKSVDLFKSTAGVVFSYSSIATTMLQDASPIRYRNHAFTISPKFNARPTSWVELNYNGQITMSQLQIDFANSSKQPYLHQVYQQLSLGFNLWESFQIQVKGEHFYNELIAGNAPVVFFCDLGFRYKLKRVEFTADWNNILNKKTYAYSSYGGLNTASSSYEIRPTNVMFGVSFRF